MCSEARLAQLISWGSTITVEVESPLILGRIRMHPITLRIIVRLTVFLKFLPTPFKYWSPIRSLTPFQLYVASGGDEYYWDQVPESPEAGVAIVLGGFRGSSSIRLATKGYQVIAFEPMPGFAQVIRHRAELKKLNIKVIEAAVSDSDGFFTLEEDGERTAGADADKAQGAVVVAKKIDIAAWVKELNTEINILEINIEGSEYDVLKRLLQSEEINRVERLNIQFHEISDNSKDAVEDIRKSLAKTHNLLWSFDWIWEAWEIKPELGKSGHLN
jgi:FkbM family methyltransferase